MCVDTSSTLKNFSWLIFKLPKIIMVVFPRASIKVQHIYLLLWFRIRTNIWLVYWEFYVYIHNVNSTDQIFGWVVWQSYITIKMTFIRKPNIPQNNKLCPWCIINDSSKILLSGLFFFCLQDGVKCRKFINSLKFTHHPTKQQLVIDFFLILLVMSLQIEFLSFNRLDG